MHETRIDNRNERRDILVHWNGDLSIRRFQELIALSNDIRDKAAGRKDWQTYKDADRMNALLYRFTTDLWVEGRMDGVERAVSD
jgi:hypothetical protein